MHHYLREDVSLTPITSEEWDARLAAKRFPPTHALENFFDLDSDRNALAKTLFDGRFLHRIAYRFGESPAVVDGYTHGTVVEMAECWLSQQKMDQDQLPAIWEYVRSALLEIISCIC